MGPPLIIEKLLAEAGVRINGSAPHDVQVNDPSVYREVLTKWSLGLGETYMDGHWDCERLDELFNRLFTIDLDQQAHGPSRLLLAWEVLRAQLFNLQSKSRAFEVGKKHYDIGNDVFSVMLDSRMIYSCAYWEQAQDLETAQLHKLQMICEKLELQPGETLLDIGCGWGGLAAFAAENYGVKVTGVTVSREQKVLGDERCKNLPVEIRLCDYRDLTGQFDKIVSVGMFEHVGAKNYPVFFDVSERLMKEDGLFLLHTIGVDRAAKRTDPWINRYIFPNSHLPSAREIATALEERFLIEDWHNFGQDYDRTLMAWHARFNAAWPTLAPRYNERFQRMFNYYLLSCAGLFRSRQGQLWQLVLSTRRRRAIYRSKRFSGLTVRV